MRVKFEVLKFKTTQNNIQTKLSVKKLCKHIIFTHKFILKVVYFAKNRIDK